MHTAASAPAPDKPMAREAAEQLWPEPGDLGAECEAGAAGHVFLGCPEGRQQAGQGAGHAPRRLKQKGGVTRRDLAFAAVRGLETGGEML